jgi:signal peptidase I
MMGDNRDNSMDSRFWETEEEGPVPFVRLEKVKGKAMFIYWSWNSEDFGVRWRRIGDWLK